MEDDDLLVEGMKLLLEQVESEVDRAESEHQRLVEALTMARARLDALNTKRKKIVAALSAKALVKLPPGTATAARPMAFGGGTSLPMPLPLPILQPGQNRRAWRTDVTRRIENLLRPGRAMVTRAIFEELVAQNVDFGGIKNPLHRLVQIMSETPHLQADRKHGWRLTSPPFPSIDSAALPDVTQQVPVELDPPQKGEDDDEL
ncbi:hypothetical protein [Variovorax sp.]|jgi:hypothetical protein|uniref:hypothetical protein n=1 Tax=Variovorax sp. TaxID=1871043 RepID=UPI0037DA4912